MMFPQVSGVAKKKKKSVSFRPKLGHDPLNVHYICLI
jgi:hypothetical protein